MNRCTQKLLDRHSLGGEVLVELVATAVPLDGVQHVALQVIEAAQFGSLMRVELAVFLAVQTKAELEIAVRVEYLEEPVGVGDESA